MADVGDFKISSYKKGELPMGVWIVIIVLTGMVALAFLPICPIQFQVRIDILKNGNVIYPVYARKFPFSKWKPVFYNPLTRDEAYEFIKLQTHWFSLLAYDFMCGKFLPLDTLPIPRV